jgi:hypothetical protein
MIDLKNAYTVHLQEIKELRNKVKELQEQLNNSKNFHCPNYITNRRGYVSCDLDKHTLLFENAVMKRELGASNET